MTPRTSLRWRLRDATAEAHARLDACVGAALAHTDGYAAFLRGMQCFVGTAAQALDDQGLRRDAATLSADLADLDSVPLPVQPVAAVDAVRATGWRYVLAGSSLGARVLLPRASRLGFDAEFGARYLALQAGSPAWRAFLESLDADTPHTAADGAIDGARAAFACAQDAMAAAFDAVPA